MLDLPLRGRTSRLESNGIPVYLPFLMVELALGQRVYISLQNAACFSSLSKPPPDSKQVSASSVFFMFFSIISIIQFDIEMVNSAHLQ